MLELIKQIGAKMVEIQKVLAVKEHDEQGLSEANAELKDAIEKAIPAIREYVKNEEGLA